MLKQEYKTVEFADNHDLLRDLLDKTANDVIKYLYNCTTTLATAESCTGGMLSQAITSVSGASAIFELGMCTYSNRIKQKLLNIDHDTIDRHGAVSAETAYAMAQAIRRLAGSDIGVGITGCAGPTISEGKPVGTVYVSVVSEDESVTYNMELDKANICDRTSIRCLTVISCLDDIKNITKNIKNKGAENNGND